MSTTTKPIVITPGEPAGIGPDCLLKISCQYPELSLVAIADYSLLEERAKQLKLKVNLYSYSEKLNWPPATPGIYVDHIPLKSSVIAGKMNIENVAHVLAALDLAIEGCLKNQFHGLVTGPVHKGLINSAGVTFKGHTEWLAKQLKVENPLMLFVTSSLRLALLTTHIPLSQVVAEVTPQRLKQTLETLIQELKDRFRIAEPKVTVCGLNPHAGEQGYLGREEIEIISPVLEELRKKSYQILGPVPADTAFIPSMVAKTDVFLSLYHDQSLPVIKSQFFREAVNMTLGLPIIRTSVDHGTALDIAGTGLADPGSLYHAIKLAQNLY